MDITNCNFESPVGFWYKGIYSFEEKTFSELEELEVLLTSKFTKLSNTKHILSNLYEYLDTFDKNVKKALQKTNTKTGDIPYRGKITIRNLGELFKIMPDLYDYLKIQFSAVESGGDVIINDILDESKDGTFNEKKYVKYENYFDYIEDDYYNDYLPGYLPVLFSVNNYAPYCTSKECGFNSLLDKETVSFPRDSYWWKTYSF